MKGRAWVGWAFVAPATLHLVVFAIYPIVASMGVSLAKWNLLTNERSFVGMANYAYAFADPIFWKALRNSLYFSVLSVPAGMAFALAVACLVGQKIRGMAIFRAIYYIPAISSGVAIAMLWIYVYLPETGLINSVLGLLHIDNHTDFLKSQSLAMPAVAFMSMWTGLGPRMILFLAGLLAIPEPLYEAAALDGATAWRKFRSVTLPMLAPTTFFVAVTSTIGALQMFTPIYVMTKGGPNEATEVVGYHIYVEAWSKFLIGIASAKSFLLLIVVAGVSYLQYRAMRDQLEGYVNV